MCQSIVLVVLPNMLDIGEGVLTDYSFGFGFEKSSPQADIV